MPCAARIVALLALLIAAPARAGIPAPDFMIGVGRTFAVTGTPDDGGLAGTLDLAWRADERVRIGVRVFAEDLGTTLGRLPGLGGATDGGAVAEAHRACWGVSWLAEAGLWRKGAWLTAGAVEWGGHRIQDDQRGSPYRALTAIGTAVTLRAGRDLGDAQTLSLALRWRQVFTDRREPSGITPALATTDSRAELPSGWASAALVWGWGPNH